MGWFLLLLVIAGLFWHWRKGSILDAPVPSRTIASGSKGHHPPDTAQRARLPGSGDFDLEIVGESNYQRALRRIAGKGEVRHDCTATLIMEDDNQYDDMAVRVDIDGDTVGYLARAVARDYRRQIESYGRIVGECNAVVIGGGPGRSLGVWLDLPTAD